ncbi:MAG: AAA family ATPase, partial [Treponema sp.]|nr:AAA family ATPase [Treponema sp.]
MKFGVLGKSLPHTYSPQIHKAFADYEYTVLERSEEQVHELFNGAENLDGFNVTIPYKKLAASLCAELSDEVRELGAANTIVKLPDGGYKGYNTDVYGFAYMLESAGIEVAGMNCLILGTGGASVAVEYALKKMGAAQIDFCSRTGKINYENVYDAAADTQIVVNATPVGMFPNVDDSPVDLSRFSKLYAAADIVYNPSRTRFLQQAQELGVKSAGGLSMLVAQAWEASEIFNGTLRQAQGPHSSFVVPELVEGQNKINSVIEKLQSQMLNVTLIGMPGCGKTTLGKKLAAQMNRTFIDLDEEFSKEYGATPAQIITQKGEDEFRAMETQLAKKILPQSGLVIATGGGIVTRKENWFYLRANSLVIYIERPLEFLLKQDTSNRPLSQNNKIE